MTEQTPVGHAKADETDEYVGRGRDGRSMVDTPIGDRGWLGNPFEMPEYDREEAIRRFREAFNRRLDDDPAFREAVRELHGQRLGCWCRSVEDDEPACHGDVIAEAADRLADD